MCSSGYASLHALYYDTACPILCYLSAQNQEQHKKLTQASCK